MQPFRIGESYIVEPSLKHVVQEFLRVQLADTVKARQFTPDGRSVRVPPSPKHPVRAQDKAPRDIALSYQSARLMAKGPDSVARGAVTSSIGTRKSAA